jgi:hypothetical protein
MKQILIAFLLTSISLGLSAQAAVSLKGSKKVIEGTIVKYDINKEIIIKTEAGSTIYVPKNRIAAVYENGLPLFSETDLAPQGIKEGKVYYIWEGNLLPNQDLTGIGTGVSAVYQWKYWAGAGLGIGYNNYNGDKMRSILPVYVHLRSYLKQQRSSPFLDLKTGYGFRLGKEEGGIIDINGGGLIQGLAGIRFGSGGMATTVGIGMQMQNAYFQYLGGWNPTLTTEVRQYNRLVIQLGFVF